MSTATTTRERPRGRQAAHYDPTRPHHCPCGRRATRMRNGWCCERCAAIEERGGVDYQLYGRCGGARGGQNGRDGAAYDVAEAWAAVAWEWEEAVRRVGGFRGGAS